MASRRAKKRPVAVVAPEFMPVTFTLWGSPRNILENYLNARSRPPREVHENLHFLVDEMLREVLDGRDPRSVFDLRKGGPEETRSAQRAKAMCAEVMRLVDDDTGTAPPRELEASAKQLVADAFHISLSKVQSAHREWRDHLAGFPDFLRTYRSNLRTRKLIK